jgi:hypothetical protein
MATFYPPDLRDLVDSHVLSWQVGRDGLMTPTLTLRPELRKIAYRGKIAIRVKRAEYLYNTSTFGKMDPIVTIKYGPFENKTPVHKNGHQNPEWNAVFEFPVRDSRRLTRTRSPVDTGLTVLIAFGSLSVCWVSGWLWGGLYAGRPEEHRVR